MSLSEIAAIAELIASVGVIASLLFLAVQIRKGSAAENSANVVATVRAFSDWAKEFGANEEWAELCHKGLDDYEGLSDIEQARFSNIMTSLVILVESVVLSNKLGVIGEEELAAGLGYLERYAKHKGFRDWWFSCGRNMFTKTFVKYVENLDQIKRNEG